MTDYDTDLALWVDELAALLRACRFDELDRHNFAEKLETLARGLRRELGDCLTRLLQHLLQRELLEGHRLPGWYVVVGSRAPERLSMRLALQGRVYREAVLKRTNLTYRQVNIETEVLWVASTGEWSGGLARLAAAACSLICATEPCAS